MNSYGIGSTKVGVLFLELTVCAGRGCTGYLLQSTFTPACLAARFFTSFSFTRRRKSSLHFECLKCSILMLIFLGIILLPNCLLTTTHCLLTTTPTALLVTLNTL